MNIIALLLLFPWTTESIEFSFRRKSFFFVPPVLFTSRMILLNFMLRLLQDPLLLYGYACGMCRGLPTDERRDERQQTEPAHEKDDIERVCFVTAPLPSSVRLSAVNGKSTKSVPQKRSNLNESFAIFSYLIDHTLLCPPSHHKYLERITLYLAE